MPACPAFNPLGPYVSNVLGFIDCHSLALGQQGYLALARSSMFGVTLSGILAIFVALVGYRVMLTGQVSIRDAVSWVAKIGVVLALALSWSAYQPLVYNLVVAGPQDLSSTILAPAALGGNDPLGLAARVDGVNTALAHVLHPERDEAQVAPAPSSPPPSAVQPTPPPSATAALSVADRKALTSATNDLTVTAIAGGVAVRVLVALMLALGPLFVATLLFDVSRGLFVGWLRTLVAASLGAVVVPAVLSLELAVIEPQVLNLVSLFDAGKSLGPLPERIFATGGVFALVMLFGLAGAAFAGAALAGAAIRLPSRFPFHSEPPIEIAVAPASAPVDAHAPTETRRSPQRDRVQVIADAARAMERRDAPQGYSDRQRYRLVSGTSPEAFAPPTPAGRLGQIGQRERIHRSAAAGRRDQKR